MWNVTGYDGRASGRDHRAQSFKADSWRRRILLHDGDHRQMEGRSQTVLATDRLIDRYRPRAMNLSPSGNDAEEIRPAQPESEAPPVTGSRLRVRVQASRRKRLLCRHNVCIHLAPMRRTQECRLIL